MTDNKKPLTGLQLWDKVSKTDPDHTKPVSFGRKFTAIDAHSQVMEATRLFGPVGSGWGYRTAYGLVELSKEVCAYCDLTLWWKLDDNGQQGEFGPIRGCASIEGFKADGKPKPIDHDAFKKAMTDALTKGLSHLGFNADVFLGMFDDNKYVEQLRQQKNKELNAAQRAYAEDRKKFIDAIQACKSADSIDAVVANYEMWITGLPVDTATEIRAWISKCKAQLKDNDDGTSKSTK